MRVILFLAAVLAEIAIYHLEEELLNEVWQR